jgi:hypothetical protein
MKARRARDDEVEAWRRDGWVLLDGLIDPKTIDGVLDDLHEIFPTAAEYHADPEGVMTRYLGTPPPAKESFRWPDTGPGFRPEQHRWRTEFPFSGAALNRLCVHPSIVDFMARALDTDDIRLYQAQVNAKYTGDANYEQPLHTDRNHSWLPAHPDLEWSHVESFLYLSDVYDGNAPTHLVRLSDARDYKITAPLLWPANEHEAAAYAAEQPAAGPRGSLLVYRTDVFHRGVDLTEPYGARYLLNVSYKKAGHEWIGFTAIQSRATSQHFVRFVEESTPRELALFGFPPPGHPMWTPEFLDLTAERYPKLDLQPWRKACRD